MIDGRARQICALLIAKRFVHKSHLREMLLDEELRREIEESLKTIGLELVTHIFTDYVAVRVSKDMETTVFNNGKDGFNATNEILSRGALALLTILWSKIVLPKRQLQLERRSPEDDNQNSLLFTRKPIPKSEHMVEIDEKALRADFGEKLGGKLVFGRYLNELLRARFIVRRGDKLYEGPLLDTLIDYSTLAPRVINGALGEMLGISSEEEISDSFDTHEDTDVQI